MNEQIQMIAEALHSQLCEDDVARSCRRWASGHETGVRHRAYYTERAETIYSKLKDEIGGANVLLAVQVITAEAL